MSTSRRVRSLNEQPPRPQRDYVLYWMVAARRPSWNFALDHAIAQARSLGKPLVVLEALRLDYPYASPRLHAFVLQGMLDNAAAFAQSPVRHLAYVEDRPRAGRGLLEALCRDACLLISDEWPSFFVPRAQRALAERIDVCFELVDGNGITRLCDSPREFTTAQSFRRWFQARAVDLLAESPDPDPLARCELPAAAPLRVEMEGRWGFGLGSGSLPALLKALPLPPRIGVVAQTSGGQRAARQRLAAFLCDGLPRYDGQRNSVAQPASSGLSPYLHFGHLSAHEVLAAVLRDTELSRRRLAELPASGARSGWWGLDAGREAFLDQLIVWRELGHHFAHHRWNDYLHLESLPTWAQDTLGRHWNDKRPHVYSLEQFEQAATHDPIWNAAQLELRETGSIHNYLRMLWGKKILHWSPTPEHALATMITLNDRWALDGRDPNSYSGIFWILGRFDRPWGPERPIFGTVRYMSSENTQRKLRLAEYLQRFGGNHPLFAQESS